jgi:hypothetical protein
MKKVLVLLIAGSVLSGVAAYAAIAKSVKPSAIAAKSRGH